MKCAKGLLVLGILVFASAGECQEGKRWSLERNILPEGMEAREAKLVILSDGSLNITFRGSEIDVPEIGGIFFMRSANGGYSWSKPKPAVSVPGIQNVTHEIQSEGGSLLLYVAVFRPPNFEVVQFVSTNAGQTWRETDTIFAETDPIRAVLTWKNAGRMHLVVLTERARPGNASEFTYWLIRGRASGAYWDPQIKIKTVFAGSISGSQLVDTGIGDTPSVYWTQDGYQDWVLEVVTENPLTWRSRPVTTPPTAHETSQEDRGVYYRVMATRDRRILFNRTDDEPPTTSFVSSIPRFLTQNRLDVVWEGKDDYTLPGSLTYELQLDENPATTIRDATQSTLESLVNGNHRLSIVAVDEAGNCQVPPTVQQYFVVRVLPVPRFINPKPNALLNQGDLTASWTGEHNCGPDSQLLFSLKVDDRDWTEFAPATSIEVTGLDDGEHAFFLRAKDALDNMSEEGTSVRFEIDKTPPDCVAEELPREWDKLDLEWPGLPDFKVEFRVTGTDNRTPGDDLEYRYRLDEKAPSDWLPITGTTVLEKLDDGMHKISFETRDQAQNIQAEPTTIDFDFNTPPNTRVWLDETREPATFRFAGVDDNSDFSDLSFRWRLDEQQWSDWGTRSEVPAVEIREGASHGEHTLQVQARDPSGNVDISPAELVIDVDTLPPDAPTGLIANDRDDGAIVELSWGTVSEPNVRYNVYRSTNETFDRDTATLVVPLVQRSRTSDRPTRLENTTTYYYYVTSVDRSNNESDACEPYAVEILGEIQVREKEFKAIVLRAGDMIRAGRWEDVAALTSEGVSPPAGFEAYPDYWNAVTQAGIALSEEPAQIQKLLGARKALAEFLERYPEFSEAPLAQERFAEVKSKILWNRMKVYGIYGSGLVVLLVILVLLYRWVQNRRITEMPMITIADGADEITPSKEALKDPVVLRRWAEVQGDRESSENWSRLAFAFHNIGEIENAIQSLYKALEISPENTRFHFQMGHFQREAENLRESVRHFERYLQLNPESKKSAEEVKEILENLKEEIKKS